MDEKTIETRALLYAREAIAAKKDADGAPHSAAAVRAGAWDEQHEVKDAALGARAAIIGLRPSAEPPVTESGVGGVVLACGAGGVGGFGGARVEQAQTLRAPPASGVDAVAELDAFYQGWLARWRDRLASLSPAATSGSEAGGEPDMRRVCEALGFDPTNHHNAAKCPYCTPTLAKPASPPASGDKQEGG